MSAALERAALKRGFRLPAPATLQKYGLTMTDWLTLLKSHGWKCPICGTVPTTGKMVTDHEHVRGWSAMPDEQRKLYVRGITCWRCNRYALQGNITIRVAQNTVRYLTAYERRRDLTSGT